MFVTVARLEPVKNLPLLLDAFARGRGRARRPAADRRQRLAGGPAAGADRRARARSERVELLGYVASPRPYLGAADAFVLASNEEGFGQVLSEAMREGLPVISTDAAGGGARFVLDDGRAGMLVPREDRAALAEAMAAMADPGVRGRYAALARERARALRAGAGRRGAPPPDRAAARTRSPARRLGRR